MNLWEAAVSVYVMSIIFIATSTAMVDAVHWRAAQVHASQVVTCANQAAEQWLRGGDATGTSADGCSIRVQVERRGWTGVVAVQDGSSQTLWLES